MLYAFISIIHFGFFGKPISFVGLPLNSQTLVFTGVLDSFD